MCLGDGFAIANLAAHSSVAALLRLATLPDRQGIIVGKVEFTGGDAVGPLCGSLKPAERKEVDTVDAGSRVAVFIISEADDDLVGRRHRKQSGKT